jgi:N-methylhydantoinase B
MSSLDPVDYAVISQALIAAAREMGVKLIRSAYSTVVREARDCSAGLLDANGEVVAQAELIPQQLGPMSDVFGPCAELYPVAELVEGDFYISNDPFHGGQHLPDIYIFSPIFFEGRVVGFGATTAHHLDLGGGSPGLNQGASDVYQEGLRIPPSKYNLHRDWGPKGPFQRLVEANIRVPDQTIGDLNAQFAANGTGAARVQELCRKYGTDKVAAVMRELQAYSERRVRAALRAIPDGTYVGEDFIDDDGVDLDTPLKIRATVTKRGDTIDIDFNGTCGQVPRNLNSPHSSTISAALSAVKVVATRPDIPFNEGVKRAITIRAPYGSLLNPKPPAPVRARMEATFRVFNAVMKALAQAVPQQVMATGFDTTTVGVLSTLGENGFRVYLEILGGGYGASARRDGCDAADGPMSNCSNTPIEALDMEFEHFRVEEYALVPESFGHGQFRGGLGFRRRYRILKDGVVFSTYSDRHKLAPQGLFGGHEGTTARFYVERGGKTIPIKSKDSLTLQSGDVLTMQLGGGAGYGPPTARARELVERDVAEGFLSRETADRIYRMAQAAE